MRAREIWGQHLTRPSLDTSCSTAQCALPRSCVLSPPILVPKLKFSTRRGQSMLPLPLSPGRYWSGTWVLVSECFLSEPSKGTRLPWFSISSIDRHRGVKTSSSASVRLLEGIDEDPRVAGATDTHSLAMPCLGQPAWLRGLVNRLCGDARVNSPTEMALNPIS